MIILPPPMAFGMPAKFDHWRKNQDIACETMTHDHPRFLVQVAPTGSGKSVTYMTAAKLITGRTIILTSTKGLQTQLMKDFGNIDGVVDIRGRGNYACRLNTQINCDIGPCMFGVKCSMKEEGGCFYFDQLKKATRSKIVITNYSYWMSQNEYSDGIGNFDMMVLDEAHSAPNHVIDHTSVTFSKRSRIENRLLELDDSLPNDALAWSAWAIDRLLDVEAELERAKINRKEKQFIMLKRLVEKLKRLRSHMDKSWVWEDGTNDITFSPVWSAKYTDILLFLGIQKVVLTSATVVPKTAELLGIHPEFVKYEEYPHTFPVENRPLIHLPTVRMNWKNGPLEERLWLNKIDSIIRGRQHLKGIIHTVSYARRDKIMEHSKYSDIMITHNRQNTESVVRTFKRTDGPCILVSPSMATGWDFPDDECRYQIIIKLPYPDTRGKIIRARSKQDSDFIPYTVIQQLIQATGRGVRNKSDWCENFITDNNIQWFLESNEKLMVKWFKESYKMRPTIPQPLQGG